MALDENSVAGDVAGSIEIIGGLPPYTVSLVDSPNDFAGILDLVATDSDHIFNFVLNALGVGNLTPLTGQVRVVDALRRSVTFDAFTIPLGPISIALLPPPAPTPTTGSFYDNTALGTVVIQLSAVGGSGLFVFWEIVSGFDNATGNSFLTINTDGSMTLNQFGVDYYTAHPGDGTLTGFVQVTDNNGLSPPEPTQITFTVLAHPVDGQTVASISMVHTIA